MTGPVRLVLAAALCAASLGLGWSSADTGSFLTSGYVPGTCSTDYDGYMSCTTGTVGYYYNPTYGMVNRGYGADARVVLVPAAAALAWAARRRTRTSERVVLVAAVALAAVALRAGVDGQSSAALVGGVAAVLAASVLRTPTRAASPPGAVAGQPAGAF